MHRYVGLLMTVFLVMSGLTGAVLPFYEELDAWINPELLVAPSGAAHQQPRDILELRDELERSIAGARLSYVELNDEPGRTAVFFASYDPSLVANASARDDEFFVDRRTGQVLGSRRWGDITQGPVNLVPFLYRLHYTLGLGDVGRVVLGLVALLWTIDCFVGAYLTFPQTRGSRARGPDGGPSIRIGARRWLATWGRCWRVRTSRLFGLVFTWHRASGLWVWGMLLVVAWSSVALNLEPVYSSVTGSVFETDDIYAKLPRPEQPKSTPTLSWQDARRLGHGAMQSEASTMGFSVLEERSLAYSPTSGLYTYKVLSSLDVSVSHPSTIVWIDADTGAPVAFYAPTGRASGDTITTWLTALHFGAISIADDGRIASLAYRIFVSLVGLLVVVLCVTGVWIWSSKRTGRARASSGPATR
ncbi:MAG: PepSY-associated TM helix domain-containing protein [Myxococcota bacterium]